MNALWAFVLGVTTTAALGGAAVLLAWRSGRFRIQPRLTGDDHDALEEHFREHAEAVAVQVSSYADQLCGGDETLRERLRRFERGSAR